MASDGNSDLTVPASAVPFLAVGALAIVAGGLVAAVTRPLDFDEGSWLAAYLVLVGGVGLIGLGTGQAVFAPRAITGRTATLQLGAWVFSTVAVVAGTLASVPALTTVGGLVLLAVLVSFIGSVRGSTTSGIAIWCYRAILGILVVSIPIGLLLSWQRHG